MAAEEEAIITVESLGAELHIASSDQEGQRGRRRRRGDEVSIITNTESPSGESATFRGRRRHRSTSSAPLSGLSSRSTSRNVRDTSLPHSPSRRCILWLVQIERRRSPSPSRSRSPDSKGEPVRRRRRRTRSRGRNHQVEKLSSVTASIRSQLQPESIAVRQKITTRSGDDDRPSRAGWTIIRQLGASERTTDSGAERHQGAAVLDRSRRHHRAPRGAKREGQGKDKGGNNVQYLTALSKIGRSALQQGAR